MTGCDRSLVMQGDFILLRMALVDALGGDFESALVFQRICWRAERDGHWSATRQQIQDETRLSKWKVDKALRVLRERDWLLGEAEGGYDRTVRWTPRFSGDASPGIQAMDDLDSRRSTSLLDSETTTTPLPPAPAPTETVTEDTSVKDDDGFEEFWRAFPRKERQVVTRAAYRHALESTDPNTLLAGAKGYARKITRDGTEPRYIQTADRWLREERWTDDYAAPRADRPWYHVAE